MTFNRVFNQFTVLHATRQGRLHQLLIISSHYIHLPLGDIVQQTLVL